MHVYEMCLSRIIINYRHVSIAVAVIVRVTYRITGSPSKLLKCISEPLFVTRNVTNLAHVH